MAPLFRGERMGMMTLAVAAIVGTVLLLAFRAVRPATPAHALTLRPSPSTPQPSAARVAPSSSANIDGVEPVSALRPETQDPSLDAPPVAGTSPAKPPTSTAASAAATEIVVHVAGAVKHPGVYHLHKGARCDDALKAAGGPTKEANTDAVNLAAHIEDGTQLYLPTRKEHPGGADLAVTPESATASPSTSSSTSSLPGVSKHAGRARSSHTPAGKGSRGRGGRPGKLTTPGEGTVELNTANAIELQRLPGVGPSLAQRILDYRTQNGPFHKVDDLMQVSGIGPKKFDRLQSFVHIK